MNVRRILVTGEGPWTYVGGSRPGLFLNGSHISEVRTLCVAQALAERGYEVSFLSSRGEDDDPGGFAFRCVGPSTHDPGYYDVVVCHQAMFWYARDPAFDQLKRHPSILLNGDLLPMGPDALRPNLRWVFFDAPNHPGRARYAERLPSAVVRQGCFGVTSYAPQPSPYRTKRKRVVYLGKIYPGGYALAMLNRLADADRFEVWFGGRVDGSYFGLGRDSDLTAEQRARLFSPRVRFVAEWPDHQGPTTIMEAAAYAQHADLGLVFDPHVRHATVSKICFYLSFGLPMLCLGAPANAQNILTAQAGTVMPETGDDAAALEAVSAELDAAHDRGAIHKRALWWWGYHRLVGEWINEWEAAP